MSECDRITQLKAKLADQLASGDGSEHIPGKRCVDGLVGGSAGKIKPVTNPNQKKAEQAVRDAGRASAIADAQKKCDKGKCKKKGMVCTFVKMIEASVVNSTPSRDPQGRIQWTAKLVSFDVVGPCICQKKVAEGDGEGDDSGESGSVEDSGFFRLPDGRRFDFSVGNSRPIFFVPGTEGDREIATTSGETAGSECNDAISNYETDYSHQYFEGNAQIDPQTGKPIPITCAKPTPAQEAAGMQAAKDHFKDLAAKYCEKGSGCTKPKVCAWVKASIKVKKTGISHKIVDDGAPKNTCSIDFALSGPITCRCQKKAEGV